MNSEPISGEALISELSVGDATQVVLPVAPLLVDNLPDSVQEPEEFAFAKAPTLMIKPDEESSDEDALALNTVVDATPKYYIQGVVLGRRACLITNVLDGSSQTLFQPQMVWTIGRNREAALPLRDRALSRRHAVILYVPDEGFYLVDLNSMNGSFINGMRIQQRQLLKDGDCLRLGSFKFSFFTSNQLRSIDPIHPEVLARFTGLKSRTKDSIDYLALEEPDVLFRVPSE
ncbi:FHA domain-containing protein [Leptolyngbyaceae cyanobacterium JSC-12]|nr:FHA domain-containing protein [Leptolyngbyaceae cyanobacterium JSC-12]